MFKRILIVIVTAMISTIALAADNLPTKAPIYQYPTAKCGIYYGANVGGSAGQVNNAVAGTQVVQGAIGVTVGWSCPMGGNGAAFWFADGDFDFTNLNGGNTNGFALSGPASFTQRFGFGAPINLIAGMIPGLSTLQSQLPGLIPLPPGVAVNTSNPYLFAALNEDDISNQNGLQPFHQFLVSVGFGIGNKVLLNNGVVFDPFVEYDIPTSQVCVGPSGLGCVKAGNKFRIGSKLEF
jgi:hypothetical protein